MANVAAYWRGSMTINKAAFCSMNFFLIIRTPVGTQIPTSWAISEVQIQSHTKTIPPNFRTRDLVKMIIARQPRPGQ